MNIILASTSSRRSELLRLADIKFDTLSVDIDESYLGREMPIDYIRRMTTQKMHAAMSLISPKEPTLVLTADTIGVLPDGQILTKPTDQADAFRMWRLMSGRVHEIWTAVQACLMVNGQAIFDKHILEKTEVCFIELNDKKMQSYWQTGEPTDKAGAYAIQGRGGAWVKSIKGSYSNVVGLPLAQVLEIVEVAQDFLDY